VERPGLLQPGRPALAVGVEPDVAHGHGRAHLAHAAIDHREPLLGARPVRDVDGVRQCARMQSTRHLLRDPFDPGQRLASLVRLPAEPPR
jgi:hypothetical protein